MLRLGRLEHQLAELLPAWSMAPVVEAVQAMRGGALTVVVPRSATSPASPARASSWPTSAWCPRSAPAALTGAAIGGAAGAAAGALTNPDDVDLGDPVWRRGANDDDDENLF